MQKGSASKKHKEKKPKKTKKEKKETASASSATGNTEDLVYSTNVTRNILVIDSDSRNWDEIFEPVTGVKIDQCEWEQLVVQADSNGVLVNIKPNKQPAKGTGRDQPRVFKPDFVLVRQLVRGLGQDEDYTNALYGLIFSGIPAVNSLLSIQQSLERPVVYSQLKKIKEKLGEEKFRLIPMSYYSHHSAMRFHIDPPFVVKVGYAEAGYGKMKFTSAEDFGDFRGVIALHKDYVTLERYIENREYDIRVQKVGTHLRAYKRTNPYWKGNVGQSHLEEIEVTPTFAKWAKECGKLFGGMDILTVDAIHTSDGKDWILEINDTASGFWQENQLEDMKHVRELVLQRMREAYPEDS